MLYFFTKDVIASIIIPIIVFSIITLSIYYFNKVIITDEGIKVGFRLYKWDEISLIAVYPKKYMIIYIKLPSAIHRVGAGIRVRFSDIAQYTIKYDEELINIFKNKLKDKHKIQIKNIPYYSFDSLKKELNSLKTK
jgi:hypothetical protein